MWGGLLAGAVEGASKAAYSIADEQIKNRDILAARALDRKEKSEDRIAEIETEMRLKEEFANRLLAKENEGFKQSKELAPEIGRRKDAGLLANHAATNVAGDAPAMSQDEIAALLKEHPEYRSIYEKAGYMPRRRASDELDLQVEAAGEVGAPATVRKELMTAAANASKEEKAADDAARQERRLEENERKNRESERLRDKSIGVMADRVARIGAPKPEKPPSVSDLRASAAGATKNISEAIGVPETDASFSFKLKKIRENAKKGDEGAINALQIYEDSVAIRKEARDAINKHNKIGTPNSAPNQNEAPAEGKSASAKVEAPKTTNSPPISSLQEGKNTTFGNGQVWTLVGGKPQRVK